jgi:hypothetical protein
VFKCAIEPVYLTSLLDADEAAGALLLEWLDPRQRLTDADLSVAVPVAGRLLRRLAVPVSADWSAHPMPSLQEWAADLATGLPDQRQATGQPFPRTLVGAATELAAEFTQPTGDLVVIRICITGTSWRDGMSRGW